MMKNITVKENKFTDKEGREVILRGINMVCKDKEKNFLGGYDSKDYKILKSLGFNVIRLGMFWKAMEPSPGCYDIDYLNEIEKYVIEAGKYGLNVFIDMHQDLFGDKFSDGAPDWAIINNLDHVETELWSESYLLSPAVQTAFDDFFSNRTLEGGQGVLDHYKKMWQVVIQRMAKHENVIGYDFMNEPFMGTSVNGLLVELLTALGRVIDDKEMSFEELQTLWLDPEKKMTLMSLLADKEKFEKIIRDSEHASQTFESEVLQGFYDDMTEITRTIDTEAIVFIETNYFSNMGMKSAIRKTKGEEKQCFAPHGYDLLVDTEAYELTNNDRVEIIFRTHESVAKENNMPMLIGEWGCFPDATSAQVEHAKQVINLFEEMLASDTYFDYDHIEDNKILEALNRAYPIAIAGDLEKYKYDFDNKELLVSVRNYKVGEESLVYLPSRHIKKINIENQEHHLEVIEDSESCILSFISKTKDVDLRVSMG